MRPCAVDEDRPVIWPIAARKDSDKGALSSSIVADQSDDLAAIDAEVCALQRLNVAETPDNTPVLD
jgi:hypothetical protein